MNAVNQKIVIRSEILKNFYPGESSNYRLCIDKDGDLWIYAANNTAKGVFYYSTSSGELRHICRSGNGAHLGYIVNGIVMTLRVLI
jgi:hypothetical protein